MTLKDAVTNLAISWEKITPSIIIKCWNSILNAATDSDEEDDIHSLSILNNVQFNNAIGESIVLLNAIAPNHSITVHAGKQLKRRQSKYRF